jgi:hypothetical protein
LNDDEIFSLFLLDLKSVYLMPRELRELKGSHWGAYIDSKSNRAVGEKTVRKSNNTGQIGAGQCFRKMLSIGMDRRFQLYHWFNR